MQAYQQGGCIIAHDAWLTNFDHQPWFSRHDLCFLLKSIPLSSYHSNPCDFVRKHVKQEKDNSIWLSQYLKIIPAWLFGQGVVHNKDNSLIPIEVDCWHCVPLLPLCSVEINQNKPPLWQSEGIPPKLQWVLTAVQQAVAVCWLCLEGG